MIIIMIGHLSLVVLDWHLQQLWDLCSACRIQSQVKHHSYSVGIGKRSTSVGGCCYTENGTDACWAFTIAVLFY